MRCPSADDSATWALGRRRRGLAAACVRVGGCRAALSLRAARSCGRDLATPKPPSLREERKGRGAALDVAASPQCPRRALFDSRRSSRSQFLRGPPPCLPPATRAPTFAAPVDALEDASFAVFGTFEEVSLDRGLMRGRVAIAPGLASLSNSDVVNWVATAVDGIVAYYRRPFTDRVLVIVMPGTPGNPTRGVTLGDAGPGVLVRASVGLTSAGTRDDWIVTHELLHVSLPSLPREDNWLSEGIATYVEPIVRARASLVSPQLILGRSRSRPPAGRAGGGRRGPREHPHMGSNVLGRRALLSGRGRRDSRTDAQRALARRCSPRNRGDGRERRGSLVPRAVRRHRRPSGRRRAVPRGRLHACRTLPEPGAQPRQSRPRVALAPAWCSRRGRGHRVRRSRAPGRGPQGNHGRRMRGRRSIRRLRLRSGNPADGQT